MSTICRTEAELRTAPIGVFDSGIGGLSILQSLRAALPAERFVYLADSGHAPYGERSTAFVIRRTLTLARYMAQHHQVKALVLACNTATAAAINPVRQHFPKLPVVGVEPALKPAAMATRTHHIGVMATQGTAGSARFAKLLAQLPPGVESRVQACDGLASAIEAEGAAQAGTPGRGAGGTEGGASHGHNFTDEPQQRTAALCQQYLAALAPFGSLNGQIDTLVLGCTHYVFAQPAIQQLVGPDVKILNTGDPVARQTKRLLEAANALHGAQHAADTDAVALFSTGDTAALAQAAERWLGIRSGVTQLSSTAKKLGERSQPQSAHAQQQVQTRT